MSAIDLAREPASRLNFGQFALDPRRVELTRNGVVLALRPKTLRCCCISRAAPARCWASKSCWKPCGRASW